MAPAWPCRIYPETFLQIVIRTIAVEQFMSNLTDLRYNGLGWLADTLSPFDFNGDGRLWADWPILIICVAILCTGLVVIHAFYCVVKLKECMMKRNAVSRSDGQVLSYERLAEARGEAGHERFEKAEKIGVCCIILSVHDVNIVEETVEVKLDLVLFCHAPDEDTEGIPQKLNDAFQGLDFLDCTGVPEKNQLSPLRFKTLKEGTIAARTSIILKLKADFTYSNFPYDVQDISIRMYFKGDSDEPRFVFDEPSHYWTTESHDIGFSHALHVVPTALISEAWRIASAQSLLGMTSSDETVVECSQSTVLLKLERRGSGYFRRYISILAALSQAAIWPLISPIEVADVMGFEVGLLFSVTAFQIIISGHLPVTPVLSIFDWYMLFLFGFIFLTIITVAVSSYFAPAGSEIMDDEASVLLMAWILIQVGFFRRVQWMRHHRHEHLMVVKQSLRPSISVPTSGTGIGTTFDGTTLRFNTKNGKITVSDPTIHLSARGPLGTLMVV